MKTVYNTLDEFDVDKDNLWSYGEFHLYMSNSKISDFFKSLQLKFLQKIPHKIDDTIIIIQMIEEVTKAIASFWNYPYDNNDEFKSEGDISLLLTLLDPLFNVMKINGFNATETARIIKCYDQNSNNLIDKTEYGDLLYAIISVIFNRVVLIMKALL